MAKCRRASISFLLSACVVAGTWGVVARPVAAQSSASIAVGRNVQVSGARHTATHYEVLAAADPQEPGRLIIGSFLYPADGSPHHTLVYTSVDGGLTWQPTLEGEPLLNTSDPALAFGPDGTAYYTAASLGPAGTPREGRIMLVYRSPDGGMQWDGPYTLTYSDRQHITVDGTGGRHHGRIYINGANRVPYGVSDFIVFTSEDGGRTWAGPATRPGFGDFNASLMGNAVVAPDGTLIGVFADQHGLQAITSRDGGRALEPAVTIDAGFVPAGHRKGAHNNVMSMPVIAIDAGSRAFGGRVYAVWADRRSGYARIFFSSSADGGTTWTTPRPIDEEPGTATDNFMPTVAVNRAGIVAVMWYDRRRHDDNLGWDVRFSASLDGGASFLPSVEVSEQGARFGPGTAWTSVRASVGEARNSPGIDIDFSLNSFMFLGGDTNGLVADAAGTFHPVWVDNRTGVPQVWTARVAVGTGSAPDSGRRAASPTAGAHDVTDSTTLEVLETTYDRGSETLSARVRLRNTSSGSLRGPFRIEVLDVRSDLGAPALRGTTNGAAGSGAEWRVAWPLLQPGEAAPADTWRITLSELREHRQGDRYRLGVAGLKVRVWSDAPGSITDAEPRRSPVVAQTRPQQAAPPSPGTLFLHPERIRLESGEYVTAERGLLFVPVNRARPGSEVIGIEVYRFRAASTARPGTPPIFRLPGGPSFAGLGSSLSNRGYFEREIAPYLEIADYVVVGQRGIGTSKPTTTCAPPAAVPPDATIAQRAAAQRAAAAACKAYWEGQGLDLTGLNVIEAAADVNDVRAALGYSTIQISGGSFGSHWGMAVMRHYPHIVARALLHGLEGPDHTYDMPSGILNSLANIAAEADTAAALRGHIPAGGLLAAFRATIERLDREPVLVTIEDEGQSHTVRVDGDAIRAVARGYAGGPAAWPANVLALHHGDYTGAARAVVRGRLRPGYPPASYFMLDCGSGISPARLATLNADPASAVLGDIEWSYRVNCPVWGADLGDAFRTNFDSTIPTVFVHGDRDLSTPLENARELYPHFSNSHFVLVRGGSHGALGEALRTFPDFRNGIMRFFATGEMAALPAELVMPPVRWVVPARDAAGEY